MSGEVYVVAGRRSREEVLDQIYSALEALNESRDMGFFLAKEDATDIAVTASFLSQTSPQYGVHVNFDLQLDFVTVVFAAEDGSDPAVVVDALENAVGFDSSRELLEEVEAKLTPRALVKFSRGYRDGETDRARAVVMRGLASDVANVRRAAALACLNLGWLSLRPDLTTACRHERNAHARLTMEEALKQLAAD